MSKKKGLKTEQNSSRLLCSYDTEITLDLFAELVTEVVGILENICKQKRME
jgi:hypothetical protein